MKTTKLTHLLRLLGLGAVAATAPFSAAAGNTSGCCDGRIVGGTEAPRNAYPWMAALVRPNTDAYNGQFCGGSLISPRYVLSAAHCVAGKTASQIQIVLGIHHLSQPSGSQRFNVSRIITHPTYNGASRGYDVALLELATPANGFATIPLASSASQISDGSVVRAIGWGAILEGGSYPDELRQVDVGIINMQTAVNNYASAGMSISNSSTMLAAGRLSGGQDTCQGDSGGPLVRSINGQWVLVGATSWGAGCARPNLPGFYANVLNLRSWIDAQMGGTGGGGGGGGGGTTDDHGNDMARATGVTAAGSTNGTINAAGDPDFFRFTLTARSQVTLQSTGSTDTMGALFSQAGSALADDDDSGADYNFRISTTLNAGTYFVRVTGYGSSTGAYVLVRTVQPVIQSEIALRLGTANVETGSTQAFGSLLTGRTLDKAFTILNSGNGTLTIPSTSFSGSSAFRVVAASASSVAPGRSTTLTVRFAPASAGAHSATLRINNNDADENPFMINLSGSAEAPVVDDFPNTIGSASRIVAVGSAINGRLERLGDADTFRFYVSRTATIRVQTTGGIDSYGHLYNSAGTQLTEDDDSGADYNFLISRRLGRGWYFVKVRGYADSETGNYTLRIAAE